MRGTLAKISAFVIISLVNTGASGTARNRRSTFGSRHTCTDIGIGRRGYSLLDSITTQLLP